MKIIIHADDEEASALLTQLATILTTDLVQRLRGIDERLEHMSKRQESIHRKEIQLMNQETIAVLGRIDAASTELAADIRALIENPNTTEAEFRAALEPKVAFLEALARDTNAPVPPVPPAETPA